VSESKTFSEKVVVVTGSSRGIGKAIALEFGRCGANVVVNYNRSSDQAVAVVAEIIASGGNAAAFKADVAEPIEAQNLVKFAIETFGDLHILVNNAGITRDNLIMMMSDSDWDSVINANLRSTFNCSKAAIRHMMRKRFGRIINISSVSGQMGNAGQTNYSASKAGQIGFTKALAREVSSRNVTVNAIAPGFIDTEILETMPVEILEAAMKIIPLGRKGKPEEIAYAVTFLASDKAGYITGQVLGVDGGMAMM
jgi:3-oxoacyl-[acyl-carrier protein] reductase